VTVRAAIAAAFVFFPLLAWACSGDFSLCKQKFHDAGVAQADGLAIPVGGSKLLIYTPRPPKADIDVADPFLGLYLVRTSKPFAHPFELGKGTPKTVAAIDAYMALPGKIVEAQTGLNALGRFEHPLADPALLSDACCMLEGIATPSGVIGREYLRHFLEGGKSFGYADAGFRLTESEAGVEIESADPFFPDNPFRAGDRVVRYDGHPVRNAASLLREILFAAAGSSHQVAVLRGGSERTVAVTLQPRFGGGLISDTYLERAGIFFDSELQVLSLNDGSAKLGLAVGDRLVQVNSSDVTFADEVRTALGEKPLGASLLFERGGFQFFLELPFHKK